MRPTLLLLVLLLTAALPGFAAPSWTEFTSAEGRFRALVPAQPSERTVTHSTPVGDIVIRHLTSKEGPVSLGVTYVDVPPLGVAFLGGRKGVFDKAAATVLEKRKGRLLEEGSVELRGMSGREMTYEAGDRQGRTWIFLEKGRLYVVDSAVPASAPEGRRFLESFEIL